MSVFERRRTGDPDLRSSADPLRSVGRITQARLAEGDQELARNVVLDLHAQLGASVADRVTSPGHLTGSAVVVDPSTGRVLVLLHRKLRRWLQPGGHADGDHELAGVALREATEETGIEGLEILLPAVDVDVHAVDHGDALGEHLHLDLRFVVVAPPGAEAPGNHESLDRRWVTLQELQELTEEPGLLRLAALGLEAAGPGSSSADVPGSGAGLHPVDLGEGVDRP